MPKPGQPQSSTVPARRTTAHRTEHEFPYIVELAVPRSGLDVSLSRKVTLFHSTRDIPLRFGRTRLQDGQLFCRYCFSDPRLAETFRAQFASEADNE
jgi:hypothetical protein